MLVRWLSRLDADQPLFIGSPGPSSVGQWYCRRNELDDDMQPDSARHRGPICCTNYSIPCHARLPATSDEQPGQLYQFAASLVANKSRLKRDRKSGLQRGKGFLWRLWKPEDCCNSTTTGTPSDPVDAADLLLVATKCNDAECCHPNHGRPARLFHWAQVGHCVLVGRSAPPSPAVEHIRCIVASCLLLVPLTAFVRGTIRTEAAAGPSPKACSAPRATMRSSRAALPAD